MASSTEVEPYAFAVADRSYRQRMMSEKTESAKIVVLYLTTLGAGTVEHGSLATGMEDLFVMQRVLQYNPTVIGAFGNTIGFSRSVHLLGAKGQTFFVEKVRLAFHATGERNCHDCFIDVCTDVHHWYKIHDERTGGLELPFFFQSCRPRRSAAFATNAPTSPDLNTTSRPSYDSSDGRKKRSTQFDP
jgi:myosin-5